jgi:8-oxo-dGTP diphosphatase
LEEAVNSNGNINVWLNQINNDFKTAISIDCVIFGYDEESLQVLLVKCDMPPFEKEFSLIGDLLRPNETLDNAAKRVLVTKTGLKDVYLEQIKCFSNIDRHPLARVVTIPYYSLVKIDECDLKDVYGIVKWEKIDNINSLAFDHYAILKQCLKIMRKRIRQKPIGFEMLPHKFSLSQLQSFYEIVLDISMDKRNFRRKLKSLNLLIDQQENEQDVAHRPAQLYSFSKKKYESKKLNGFNFEL